MSTVPMLLESYFVESLSYRARPDYDRKLATQERIDVDFDAFAQQDSDKRVMVRLAVKVGTDQTTNARCELELSLVGFFVLADGLDVKMRGAMLAQNAPSILYGVARQVAAETTGNGPWGKVFLPTMNFFEIAQQKARAAKREVAQADHPVVADKPATKR